MGKCPFWSTSKEVVKCYSDCPMYEYKLEEDLCPFKDASLNNSDEKSEESSYHVGEVSGENYSTFNI